MPHQVLIIEDDDELAGLMRYQLGAMSCGVTLAGHGGAGLAEAASGRHDLIILERMLPGIDGIEICRRIRIRERYTPVLMLSSRATDLDRVLGLEAGADDYVVKPFNILELLARVKAIFRLMDRLQSRPPDAARPIQCRDLWISPDSHEVLVGRKPVDLTAKEFELLLHFARNPGRVYSRAQLLDHVWGYHHDGYEHTVNSHINRLRAKIERNPDRPEYIQTVWGIGYKFRAQSADWASPMQNAA